MRARLMGGDVAHVRLRNAAKLERCSPLPPSSVALKWRAATSRRVDTVVSPDPFISSSFLACLASHGRCAAVLFLALLLHVSSECADDVRILRVQLGMRNLVSLQSVQKTKK